ncbi:chemotaxis protein CheA [Rubrivivax sp. RP6-9]|uniref:chemotaxis protein CheA n=1 Tax=Rubrivivax sp. RP6-9 TaxID=3415750 RepID=UPI003CC58848
MTQNDRDNSFIAEALPAFISEAHEQIERLEQLLLELEDAPDDRDLLDALFRCAHTVKGSAGIFGLDAVVGFTHHVETLLDHVRAGQVALTPALSTLLLQCNDQMRRLIADAQHPEDEDADAQAHRGALVARLQAACAQPAPARAAQAARAEPDSPATGNARWPVAVRFGGDTFRNGMDPLAILNYLRGMGEITALRCDAAAVPALDRLDPEQCHLGFDFVLDTAQPRESIDAAFSFVRDDCTLDIGAPAGACDGPSVTAAPRTAAHDAPADGTPAQDTPAQHPQAPAAASEAARKPQQRKAADAGHGDDQRFIRVQADRLDAVINLLGELVIASAGASLLARQTRQGALVEANDQISQLVEEIRNGTLQLRMVPIGETFSRFRRVVRDTAAELGKDVQLEIVGGETELDKSVVERIADPLMHLVRNGLDHGLETPEERVANGKPAQGRLVLSACHEAGSILIRIADDGRGIRRQKVLERAWERGLVERGTVPSDAEILQLVFAPGFSTAEQVTNLSGRGVGMDVVRRNIEALRGSVEIASDEGRGSRIEIRLPLTLAIIDGFLVGVGSSKFIFPLDAVVEVIENRQAVQALDARGRGIVELRGQALPVTSLRALYGLDSPAPERTSVVVLQAAGRRYGVLVDSLLGQHQTVIKPLGRMFRSLRGMSGSSILGNGEVALIFDVPALSQLAATPALSPVHAPQRATITTPEGQTP